MTVMVLIVALVAVAALALAIHAVRRPRYVTNVYTTPQRQPLPPLTITQTINNPAPERVTAAAIRRAAYNLGR